MVASDVIIPILTFLLGSLVTSLFWIVRYGDRLTKLESSMAYLSAQVATLAPHIPPCSQQQELDKRVVKVETKLKMGSGD